MSAQEITIKPLPIASARAACDRWHSHHEPPVSGLFALAAWVSDRCVCVAIVSRPVARGLDNGTTCEVVRLASDGTTRGAASSTLKACVREAAKRGYTRVVSYTLLGEVGACYRAARWRPVAVTRGGQWDTPTRRRKPSKQSGRKIRWEAGAAALPRSARAQSMLEEHAGRVDIPTRAPSQLELAANDNAKRGAV